MFIFLVFPLSLRAGEASDIQSLVEDVENATRQDLDFAKSLISRKNGQVFFGSKKGKDGFTDGMRGQPFDLNKEKEYGIHDEFWVHPDSKQTYVSDPHRPVKA
ncbi:MAG: hypothetical protein R3A11_00435 [Bdellovibrionota bacterium]